MQHLVVGSNPQVNALVRKSNALLIKAVTLPHHSPARRMIWEKHIAAAKAAAELQRKMQ